MATNKACWLPLEPLVLLTSPDEFEPSTDCLDGHFQPSRIKTFCGYDWVFNVWCRLGASLTRAFLDTEGKLNPVFAWINPLPCWQSVSRQLPSLVVDLTFNKLVWA